jgi:hypothetical protein
MLIEPINSYNKLHRVPNYASFGPVTTPAEMSHVDVHIVCLGPRDRPVVQDHGQSEQCKASYSTRIPSDEDKRKFYYLNLLFLNRFYERNRIYRQTDDARKLFELFNHTMWVEGFEHF